MIATDMNQTRLINVDKAWAKTSVNATIFRRNSIVTHGNTQYLAFYDADGFMVLAKRELGSSHFILHKTQYQGNVRDAHNVISIMVDGAGFLHVAFDHHVNPLRYARSLEAGELKLFALLPMTGKLEDNVTYPEFYRLANGNLLFMYRDGSSGRGDLVLNHYDTPSRIWTQRQSCLIDGEGQRNAYWQACMDSFGTLHLSWVWRESPDVMTNHDLCYAKSRDGGVTWETTSGDSYDIPITASTAEYAWRIPQNSTLMNQTSMVADQNGHPYIATYWADEQGVPQYQIVFHNGQSWQRSQVSKRQTAFSLSGKGSKKVPISRPQIAVDTTGQHAKAYLLFRDEERGNKASVAICNNLEQSEWYVDDLTPDSLGRWEPSYDTELWQHEQKLHLFIQKVGQGDGETLEELEPQMVRVLEAGGIISSL